MVTALIDLFPALASGNFRVTSPPHRRYNCIAWATGDPSQWWWPGLDVKNEYWPPTAPREESLIAFQQVFKALGYEICEGHHLEAGVEKVALFADAVGQPQHAARQLSSGRWTSKIGQLEDIEHNLGDLEGDSYGKVVCIMKRPRLSN